MNREDRLYLSMYSFIGITKDYKGRKPVFCTFILREEECHSTFDVWLLTDFKPHNFLFPWFPTLDKLMRKPKFSFWHRWETQAMHTLAMRGNLSNAPPDNQNKNPD